MRYDLTDEDYEPEPATTVARRKQRHDVVLRRQYARKCLYCYKRLVRGVCYNQDCTHKGEHTQ